MDVSLCEGIATIIDNGIGEEEDIDKIIIKIKERGFPTCEIESLDLAESFLPNFTMSSFIILDWNMFKPVEAIEEGVSPAAAFREEIHQKIIEFIKRLKEKCFAPVFIFTQESSEDIADQIIPKLKEEGLYFENGRNFIYVRNKRELLEGDKLFDDIGAWIESNPPIYVLKLWQREMLKAKNEVFWDLYNRSKGWPWILWSGFKDEGEDPVAGMNETLFRLVSSITIMPKLDEDKLKISTDIDLQELKDVFRRTMFLEKGLLGIKPGDIYEINGVYYLNIRPECETVEGRCDGNVYLIKGKKKSGENLKEKRYSSGVGFTEHIHEAFVFLLTDNMKDVVVFNFKNLEVKKFDEIKNNRKLRLLPPYITRIQQRFSSCIGRIGISRLPKELEKEILRT